MLIRPLTTPDLDLLEGPREQPPAVTEGSIRDSHHQMARLFALGLRTTVVAQRMGYSVNRVSTIRNSPAFENLVLHYRGLIDDEFRASATDLFSLMGQNTHRATRMIADRLEDAERKSDPASPDFDPEARPIPLKELVSIAADGADRIGYGKRQTNVNLNVDFASALEKAIARSSQVPSGLALAGPQPASSDHSQPGSDAPSSVEVLPPIRRRA